MAEKWLKKQDQLPEIGPRRTFSTNQLVGNFFLTDSGSLTQSQDKEIPPN